jgi:hypothetical protein
MARLVELWQVAQPPHRRHLAIVRDAATTGRLAYYVHYSYPNFAAMVQRGDRQWEAVETVRVQAAKDRSYAADAKPDVDVYGFPSLDTSIFQGRNNNATRFECVDAAKIPRFHTTSADSIVLVSSDGTICKFGYSALKLLLISH